MESGGGTVPSDLLERQLQKLRSELMCVICRDVLSDPANLSCNHTFCHDCILESHKVKKVCPLCKVGYQRRSVKKNMLLANVVSCYRAMQEMVNTSRGQVTGSQSKTTTTTSASEQETVAQENGTMQNSDSSLTSLPEDIAELRRQLREQERAIAEIDALLAETVYNPPNQARDESVETSSGGTKRGIKRKSSSSKMNEKAELQVERDEKRARATEEAEPNASKATDTTASVEPLKAEEEAEEEVAPSAEEDSRTEDKNKNENGEEGGDDEISEDVLKANGHTRKSKVNEGATKGRATKKRKQTETLTASKSTKFIMLGTGLNPQKTRKLRQLASKHGGKVVDELGKSVTHIVTSDENHTARRTMKLMLGVLNGLWIVNFNWVTSSLEAGMFVDEESFEINSDTVGKGGPEKGRKNGGGRSLFEGYRFHLHGSFNAPSREELKSLIATSGGMCLDQSPKKKRGRKRASADGLAGSKDDPKVVVLCDVGCSGKQAEEAQKACGRKPVSVLWLLDSISHFAPQPLSSYALAE